MSDAEYDELWSRIHTKYLALKEQYKKFSPQPTQEQYDMLMFLDNIYEHYRNRDASPTATDLLQFYYSTKYPTLVAYLDGRASLEDVEDMEAYLHPDRNATFLQNLGIVYDTIKHTRNFQNLSNLLLRIISYIMIRPSILDRLRECGKLTPSGMFNNLGWLVKRVANSVIYGENESDPILRKLESLEEVAANVVELIDEGTLEATLTVCEHAKAPDVRLLSRSSEYSHLVKSIATFQISVPIVPKKTFFDVYERSEALYNDLDESEKDAFRFYSSAENGESYLINAYMRGTLDASLSDEKRGLVAQYASSMQDIICGPRVPRVKTRVVLYRGINADAIDKYSESFVFEDPGFKSVTFRPDVALRFCKYQKHTHEYEEGQPYTCILLQIHVDEGTPVFRIPNELSPYGESEVVMSPQTYFRPMPGRITFRVGPAQTVVLIPCKAVVRC